MEDNSKVELVKPSSGSPGTPTINYTKDDGKTWTSIKFSSALTTGTITLEKKGDKVYFSNNSNSIVKFSGYNCYYQFILGGQLKVSGDLSSLVQNGGGATNMNSLSTYCFTNLFKDCVALIQAKDLILPFVTGLQSHCYDSMFMGCTNLVNAPELPATSLAMSCYYQMFYGCSALVEAPKELPATLLAMSCYNAMFQNCTSLTTAPIIKTQTSTGTTAFNNMFNGCTKLNYVEVAFTSWNNNTNTTDWLSGVSETGTFICPKELDQTTRDASHIPAGWDINPTFAFGKITAIADENGSISVAKGESTIVLDDEHSAIISGKVPSEETSITEKLTITCTPNEDYELKSLTINNQDIPLENITNNKYDYNFTYSGSEDAPTTLTISAEYKVSGTVTTKYTLTKQVTGEGGSIGLYLNTSGNEITEAEAGKTIYVVIPENVDLRKLLTLTYTPEGGEAQTITLNGNEGTFTMPDANVTVSADFDNKTHVNSINIVNGSGKVKLADNGETLQLSATVLPEDASDKTVTWSSSNDAIAKVSTDGLVTAKSAGDVTITVKSNLDSEITSTIELSVYRLPDSYTINTSNIESTNYFIGKAIDKSQITVTAHYTGGDDADITSDCEINVTAEPASALDESLKFTQSGDVTINISASYNGNAINPVQINKNIKGLSELSVDDIEMLLCDDPLTIKPKTNIENPVFTYTLPQYGRCVSIDENGVITPESPGTNTITISFAGNDDFSPAEAKFKVKVIDAEDIAVVVTAEEENATVKLAIEGTVTNLPKLHYKVNNDAHWTEYTISESIDLPHKGDKVQISRISSEIEGTGTGVYQGFSIDTENYIHFVFDKAVSVSGKISALTHKSYNNDGKFDTPYLYNSLFKGCTTLISADELSLHSSKVSESGYQSMFEGCTALKNTPALQATTIDKSSYQSMFKGCTALETTPALSATPKVSSYQSMFEGCTALKTVSQMPTSKSLNTYYATSCYQSMFEGCTALTTAPTLVATTLADSCYKSMFKGCTALLVAPALPATSLKSGCYQSMFEGCSSLTTAPTLSVTTLADSCYNSMFKGCTALLLAPELPATSLKAGCYKSMFEGCTSLTTAPELSAGSTAAYCYYRMFANCTSLEKAPDLPFTTIIFDYPLAEMFKGCKKLNYVSIIQLNNWGDDKTADWLEGVADEGTFYCNDALTKTRDASHIPTGWLVNPPNPNTFYANISTTAENGSISILREGEKAVGLDEQGKATISKLVDGESVTESLTITCTPKAGYELESLTIGDQVIPLADITDNTYEYEEFTYSGTKEVPYPLNIIATFIQATPTEYFRDIVIPEGEEFAYGTICLPSYGEVTSEGTVQFFVIDHKSDPQYDIVIGGVYSTPRYITLQEVEAKDLVSGTPYIFKATDSFSIAPSKEGKVSEPVNTPGNGLFGTFEGINQLEMGTHIIYNNLLYVVNSNNVIIDPFRAYIDLKDVPTESGQTPGVKMFNFFYNEADGIMNIYDNDNVNGNVSVNLNGQAVGVGYKGIVIMNGKKVLRR
ncbi:MAG: Ig-like domain-containing protein [Prevotellaceae bacterium]|nr:Ig-like domain-containing protein [Candidatus Colivivens equi]